MSIVSGMIARTVQSVMGKKANELDDIIAGLLINGVARDEIEVRECPDKTLVCVRGVPRYELKVRFSVKDAIWGNGN